MSAPNVLQLTAVHEASRNQNQRLLERKSRPCNLHAHTHFCEPKKGRGKSREQVEGVDQKGSMSCP
eukprot:scaffold8007_cov19-Tisochrysis_lutea.AAC.3